MSSWRAPGMTVRVITEVENAERCIADLEAVLAYYADPDIYRRRGLASELAPAVLEDAGAKARAAVPHWEDVEPAQSPPSFRDVHGILKQNR